MFGSVQETWRRSRRPCSVRIVRSPAGREGGPRGWKLLDFEGGSTVLLHHQHEDDGGQVDRKVTGGLKLKGLRTLELGEVLSADADRCMPKDGGSNNEAVKITIQSYTSVNLAPNIRQGLSNEGNLREDLGSNFVYIEYLLFIQSLLASSRWGLFIS